MERRKAFQGPNGWYLAYEMADGSHHQPANGGEYATREEAERMEDRCLRDLRDAETERRLDEYLGVA